MSFQKHPVIIMKKKTKRIFVIFILIIVGIIIIDFIYTSIILSKDDYKSITFDEKKHEYLFQDSIKNDLRPIQGEGNNNEQLYLYRYKNKYNLIVWDINGFKKINLSKSHILFADNFEEVSINPTRYLDLGNYKITSKFGKLVVNDLVFITNNGADVIKHFSKKDFAYIKILSKGLALCDKAQNVIKLVSENEMCFNCVFINDKFGFHFIVLTKMNNIEDECTKNDILLNHILKHSLDG